MQQAQPTQRAEGEQAPGVRYGEAGAVEQSPPPALQMGERHAGAKPFHAMYELMVARGEHIEKLLVSLDAEARRNAVLEEQLQEERQVRVQLHQTLHTRQIELQRVTSDQTILRHQVPPLQIRRNAFNNPFARPRRKLGQRGGWWG